ncbi:MAG TPA: peptidoglycan-binding domain-containing protein, partial [Ilumatobacteraceae bacterium]|nr:peptidoglycan-binding domain-containing protein [Ilumatobacteraceae bacterium]
MTHNPSRLNRPTSRAQRDARRAVAVLASGAALIGVISLGQSMFKDSPSQATAATISSEVPANTAAGALLPAAPAQGDATATTSAAAQLTADRDISGDEPAATTVGCKLDKRELRQGDSGNAVTCLQQALIAGGYLDGSPTGVFDGDTFAAVNKLQKEKDL